jgi:hypothetical protein
MALEYSSNTDEFKKMLARSMAAQAMDSSPIISPWQGAARLANALFAGNFAGQEQSEKDAADQKVRDFMPYLLGNGPQPSAAASPGNAPAPAPSTPSTGGAQFAPTIAGIETGGQKDQYSAVGPVTRTGDRAHGKYQVMGANVPSWTKEVLGKEMTPDEFRGNAQAQDAVFNAKFGALAQKYGPEGAAKAWFAGEGGMNNPNAKDILGTSVAQYAQKFNALNGGAQPTPTADASAAPLQVAQAGPDQAAIRQQALAIMLDPRVRPEVKELVKQQLQPQYKYVTTADGNVVAINERTNEAKPIYKGPVKGVALSPGQTLADPTAIGATGGPKDAPPGYSYVDPKNPAAGMTAIPGSEATRLPAETAGRLAMMETARKGLPEARETLMKGRGEYGMGAIEGIQSATGTGDIGRANRNVQIAIESALRTMTGAAAPEGEVKRYADMFQPKWNDSAETAKQKLDLLDAFINNAHASITQGRSSASPPSGGGGWTDVAPGVRIRQK